MCSWLQSASCFDIMGEEEGGGQYLIVIFETTYMVRIGFCILLESEGQFGLSYDDHTTLTQGKISYVYMKLLQKQLQYQTQLIIQ